MKKFLIRSIATGGGLGYSPVVSGTVGSLGGVLFYFLFAYFKIPLHYYLLFLLLLTWIGIWASSKLEKELSEKDPGVIVIDEVVGMMLTYIAVPLSGWNLVIGFILFRILDITKPFPARNCEHLHGGIGIMLDDVVSGLYACLLLHAIILLTS